jgi:hypothetical protein
MGGALYSSILLKLGVQEEEVTRKQLTCQDDQMFVLPMGSSWDPQTYNFYTADALFCSITII